MNIRTYQKLLQLPTTYTDPQNNNPIYTQNTHTLAQRNRHRKNSGCMRIDCFQIETNRFHSTVTNTHLQAELHFRQNLRSSMLVLSMRFFFFVSVKTHIDKIFQLKDTCDRNAELRKHRRQLHANSLNFLASGAPTHKSLFVCSLSSFYLLTPLLHYHSFLI